jgi:tetratricopeptide (TPR) repeat protein
MTHYSKYNDFNRAKKLFSQALDIDPTYKVVLFHLVDATLRYDGAEAARKVLAPYGDDNDPAVLEGRLGVLEFERRYDEILALKDDPRYTDVEESGPYWHALLETGRSQEALELSRRSIDESVGYSKGLAHWSHAGLLIKIGRFRAALENLSAGAPLFDSPVVNSLVGRVHVTHARALETLGDIDGAIEEARHGRSKDPYLPISRFEAARLLMREGRFEEADREVEGLALLVQDSIDPTVPCWVEMARAEKMRVQGDPAGALRALLDDGSPGCAPAVGMLKNTQGRFPERELLRARAAEDAGELEQALLHYRTLFEAPWGPVNLLYDQGIQARYEMARMEQQLGKTADARKHYREFLDDWGDPDIAIPAVEDARKRLAALGR